MCPNANFPGLELLSSDRYGQYLVIPGEKPFYKICPHLSIFGARLTGLYSGLPYQRLWKNLLGEEGLFVFYLMRKVWCFVHLGEHVHKNVFF